MEDFGSDSFDITLAVIRPAFVCKIPPRKTSAGHRCSDWDRTPIWEGRVKVVSRGEKCMVLLEHTKEGETGLFAGCIVEQDPHKSVTVEKVLDSSRFFVLTVSGAGGRKANLGLFFKTREEAFDFKVALQDHEKHLLQKKEEKEKIEKGSSESENSTDYRIPEGKTIHINFKSKKKSKEEKEDDVSFF